MTQACDLANGVEIEFPVRGIRIRPYEVSIRNERHSFSYASCKISEPAARLLDEKDVYMEPAIIKIGGVEHHRYFVPDGSIRYGEEQAWIELQDPLKILEYESITATHKRSTFNEVVSDILSRVNDPNGILNGYTILSERIARSSTTSLPLPPRISVSMDVMLGVLDRLNMTTGGFDFDNITLYQALELVCNEFEVTSWVDNSGRIMIGIPESTPENAIEVYGDPDLDGVSISSYNVSTTENALTFLKARSSSFPQMGRSVAGGMDINSMYFVAEVSVPGKDGNHGVIEEPKRVTTQQELEDIVARHFINSYTDVGAGNIEFTGMASTDQEVLATLDVGDMIFVSHDIGNFCKQGYEGGEFVVTQVMHNINPRVGWSINASVSRMPPRFVTRSYIYDPVTDTAYRDPSEL